MAEGPFFAWGALSQGQVPSTEFVPHSGRVDIGSLNALGLTPYLGQRYTQ